MGKVPDFDRDRPSREVVLDLLHKQEAKRGHLVAFEGPDGSGKTTQRKLFQKWLRTQGREVVSAKWSSSLLIKPLIRARKGARSLSPEEYSLLYAADFRHRLENEILPALWQGKMVIADGYLFTALARDSARGLELNWVLNTYRPLFWPDMVFYFAVSPETSRTRAAAVKKPGYYDAGQDITNIEDPVESYKQYISRVNQEYEALALIFKFVTLNAEQSIYEQHRAIRRLFQQGQRRPWAEWNVEAVLEWLERSIMTAEVQLGH
jgi:dTMP kinase